MILPSGAAPAPGMSAGLGRGYVRTPPLPPASISAEIDLGRCVCQDFSPRAAMALRGKPLLSCQEVPVSRNTTKNTHKDF